MTRSAVSWISCSSGPGATDSYTITPSSPASYSGALVGASTTSGVSTLTLAAGASWANGFYTNGALNMTSGSCMGYSGTITNYTGLNLQAIVSFTGCGGPSAGDTYTITPPWWVAPVSGSGTARGGTGNSISLQASGSSTVNGFYDNALLTITTASGGCMGKSGVISNYLGGTQQVATVALGCTPSSSDTSTIYANYELGYADFGARAEWPRPMALGHGTYLAQESKYHSRGDYFENAVELVGSGSSANCTLSASPGYCTPPTAAPTVEFASAENEVTRGRSTMYEDESFFMPGNVQSVVANASGQVQSHAVLSSLTLADPQFLANAAPLMSLCMNATGHALNVGDLVSLQESGGGASYNDCIDPTTYSAGSGGTGKPAEFPCFIVTAPGSATITSFPAGQPVSIALPGSQVLASVTPQGGVGVNSGALLLPLAPNGSGVNGSLTAVDPASATTQQVAQACATAIGTTTGSAGAGTLIKAVAKW